MIKGIEKVIEQEMVVFEGFINDLSQSLFICFLSSLHVGCINFVSFSEFILDLLLHMSLDLGGEIQRVSLLIFIISVGLLILSA